MRPVDGNAQARKREQGTANGYCRRIKQGGFSGIFKESVKLTGALLGKFYKCFKMINGR